MQDSCHSVSLHCFADHKNICFLLLCNGDQWQRIKGYPSFLSLVFGMRLERAELQEGTEQTRTLDFKHLLHLGCQQRMSGGV